MDNDPRPTRPRRAPWGYAIGTIAALAVIVAGVAIARPGRAEPQRLVDVYLPGVRLGAPLSDSLRVRYRLRDGALAPAPLSRGFRYHEPFLFLGPRRPDAPDGLADVAVVIGAVPAQPLSPARRNDPVTRVAFSLPTPGAATAADARLREAFGRPEVRCFAEGIRTVFWRGPEEVGGALLVVPTRASSYATAFAARLVLGAERWETGFPDPTRCPEP